MGISEIDTPPRTGAPEAAATPSRKRLLRYLFLLLLIPAIFYPFPFLIATSASYEHWSTSQWGPMLEYAYNTQPQNADVVIFGDSTAFIGVDPRILNEKLGIRSLVLPDTVGSIPVTGDLPLRTYLAHNRPPRLLVLYFSAWNLDFGHIAKFRLFEGEEMLLRHGSRGEIASFTLHHPTELLVFPFRLYSTFGPKMIAAALHHVNREKTTAEALGHADFTGAFPPLKSSCVIPAEYLSDAGSQSVQALVRRYTTPETHVVVYIAPVPGCRNSDEVTSRSFSTLGVPPPKALPAPDFAGDAYYAHVLPAFVGASTLQLANRLQGILPLESSRVPTTNP
ncbi:MAG: hypothetical protein ACRYFU_17925 [Janthinobacterium lividum]